MATSILPPPMAAPLPLPTAAPRPHRWTCAEFHQLGDMGWFEGRRVMLIDGEILEMAGPNPPHTIANALTEEVLRAAFGAGFWVRGQSPLVLGLSTDPIPDAAVVPGSPRQYVQHPTSALLVVEVSDTSLGFDSTDKASLYAGGGVTDYWVVDIVNRQLIIFRDPVADPTQPFGHRYATVVTLLPGSAVSPLALPGASVPVDDLLP